jgi:glycosyltransferase involved in cell wall biosynthesis
MNNLPRISVIMSVYNASLHLYEAINSILNQSERDFEFIIIDDGSTDNSASIINDFAQKDSRILFLSRTNRGVVACLNEAFHIAKGEFIVRMDADDISHPERLARQLAYMINDSSIGILGCWSRTIGTEKNWDTRFPEKHKDICAHMIFSTALSHPTTMIRKAVFLEAGLYYNQKFIHAEDYALWVDAVIKGLKLANCPEVLFYYRVHQNQTSKIYHKQQADSSHLVRLKMLSFFGITPSARDARTHKKISEHAVGYDPLSWFIANRWLAKIKKNVIKSKNLMADQVAWECEKRINNGYTLMFWISNSLFKRY